MERRDGLYWMMVILFVFFVGCSRTLVQERFLTEKKCIRLSTPAEAVRVIPLQKGFLLVGWKDASIRLVDEKGVEKALYSRKGKGPGELQDCRLETGGFYEGVLMLADQAQNRIMLFHVDENEEVIHFLHSFPVDRGGISSACFDRQGRILIYTPLGESEYLVYSRNGTLLEQWPGTGPLSKRGSDDPKDLLRWVGCHDEGIFAVSFLSGDLRSCIAPWKEGEENRVLLWRPLSSGKGKQASLTKEGETISIQGGLSIEGAVLTRERLYVCVNVPGEKGSKEIQGYDPRGRNMECYHLPPGVEGEELFLLGIMPGGEFVMGVADEDNGGLIKALILLDQELRTEKKHQVSFLLPELSMAE